MATGLRFATVLSLLLAGSVVSAGTTTGEEDKLIVNRLNATDFEVVETQDMGPNAFWCGAATFLQRREGQPRTVKIYLKSPRGPAVSAPGRKGVIFTTTPVAESEGVSSLTFDVKRVGQVRTGVQARSYCRDSFTRATK